MKLKIRSVIILCVFASLALLENVAAAPVNFVMITDDLTLISGNTMTTYNNASMVFHLTIDDQIRPYEYGGDQRFSASAPIIELPNGSDLPHGTYFNYIYNWSVEFGGDAAHLGKYTGTGGGLPWESYALNSGDNIETYYDCLWGAVGSSTDIKASIPEWGYLPIWNLQNFPGVGHLEWPREWAAVGQWCIAGKGYVGFGGHFNPVPEPASFMLIITGILGIIGVVKKKELL